MKPWIAAFLIEQMQLEKLGYSLQYGIDYYFAKKTGDSKEILELESAEFQLDLLNDLSEDVQVLFLESVLNDLDNLDKSMKNIFEYWINGDVEGMNDFIFEEVRKSKGKDEKLNQLFDALFDKRNVGMTEKIESYLNDEKTYFIIAGSGHFIGENGIINLLKNKGYEVIQLDKSE
jgi:uncharacterized protein YbaP (TraB family)